MARRQYCRSRMFLILALLCIYISSKPVLITARPDKSTDFETKGYGLNTIEYGHLRRIEIGQKRRTVKRRTMKVVEEINDYPGSGANNRHTPCPDC